MAKTNIRVLLGKVGLDGHDRGAKIIARAFKDAGMEVIYTGIYQTTEKIVHTAVQEDVDVVGLSSLDGGHMTFFPEVLEGLKKAGKTDVLFIGGGIIPLDEINELKRIGVAEIFRPGSRVEYIIQFIKNNVRK